MLWILAASSAILLSLSFSTFNLSLLVWVGLLPLFFAIDINKGKQAPNANSQIFWLSYLCGFLFFSLSMYWLFHVTPCGWIGLSLYQALYFGIFGLFSSSIMTPRRYGPAKLPEQPRSKLSAYLSIPALWVILEYLRANIAGGIGWNLLAYSQYQNIPLIQIADITGAYGVSFLIVLVNFSIYSVIKIAVGYQKTHKGLFVKPTLFMFIAVLAVLAYGYNRMRVMEEEGASGLKEIRVSVIQGNIEQFHKWDNAHKDEIMKKYERLTREAAKDRPGLIIWPETSLPGYPDTDKLLRSYVRDLAKKLKIPLLIGAPTVAVKNGIDIGDCNSALLFSRTGRLLKQYNKLHLVAFGEFIPFERYIPSLRRLFPIAGNFVSGNEYTIFCLRTTNYELRTNFGVLICFEDIFPGIVRGFAREGTDFMVNMTNDAWFGRTSAAYQHAANSVFRAVENRRPFIRSANTGLSCFIDRAGRVNSLSSLRAAKGGGNQTTKELFVEGYKTSTVEVIPGSPLTFYTRFGDLFAFLCLLIAGLFLIDYILRQRYNK